MERKIIVIIHNHQDCLISLKRPLHNDTMTSIHTCNIIKWQICKCSRQDSTQNDVVGRAGKTGPLCTLWGLVGGTPLSFAKYPGLSSSSGGNLFWSFYFAFASAQIKTNTLFDR